MSPVGKPLPCFAHPMTRRCTLIRSPMNDSTPQLESQNTQSGSTQSRFDAETVLFDFLLERLAQQPHDTALEAVSQGAWQQWTWSELGKAVADAGEKLLSWGAEPADRIATWSENRWEWIVWDLAIQGIGAVHVPFHASLPLAQVLGLLEHAGCRGILVSPSISGTTIDGLTAPHRWSQSIALETRKESKAIAEADLRETQTRLAAWREKQLAANEMTTLLYTSGTTGRPKGVMLSQSNLVSNVWGKLQAIPLFKDDVRFAMLPMTHIFARTCDLATWLAVGCRLILASHKDRWIEEVRASRPTYINSVPLFYQRLWQIAVAAGRRDEPGVLRKMLGGRIRVCNCGGAPLPDAVYDWFVEQGVELITGYGLTESSPVLTSSSPGAMKRGAVGRALKNVELKLGSDGEVLARGPSIMLGYYRDHELTEKTIPEGWLATGDLGDIDDQGFLTLIGRKNELIVTPGGLKIVPTEIERCLVDLDWIAQAFVTADEEGHPCGLLVPNIEVLRSVAPAIAKRFLMETQSSPWNVYALRSSSSGESCENKSPKSEVAEAMDQAEQEQEQEEQSRLIAQLREATSDLPKYWGLWRCLLESEPLSLDEGTLTAKGSLRRTEIEKRRSDALRRLLRS